MKDKVKRIDFFDIAKGIGILCMIAGHMGNPAIDRIVFTFHVPLFFLISGYFLSEKESISTFVKKKIRTLIIPYLFTGLCLVLIKIPVNIVLGTPNLMLSDMTNTFLKVLYGSGANENKTLWGIGAIGAIWFLLALFWALFIVKCVSNIKLGWAIVLIIAVVSYLSSGIVWLPWDIQAGGVAAVFVYIGLQIKRFGINFKKVNYPILIIGIVALALQVIFNIRTSIVTNYYGFYGLSIIGAVFICYLVIELSKLCEKNTTIKRILCFYGNNSIIILCVHLVELNNTPWRVAYSLMSNLGIMVSLQYFIVFIIKVMFATICTYIVIRNNKLKKIFGR